LTTFIDICDPINTTRMSHLEVILPLYRFAVTSEKPQTSLSKAA